MGFSLQFEAQLLALRNQFPMLNTEMHGKPLIYLDSAATSQKPLVVIDTITDFYRDHYGTVHRGVYELSMYASQLYEETRETVRDFLNAQRGEEIIFTRGTTESINLVASSFGKAFVQKGDEILISAMEHHSNIVPWQLLCEEKGALLKVIPMNQQGELLLEEFEKLLTDRTKIVAVAHMSNALGTINPIKTIIELSHKKGAKVLIDGAQSTPHMKIDLQELDADFFVFSSHKIYGPTGVGVLYGKYELLDQMPPYQGGGHMIETVKFEKTTFNHPPFKFEAGTPAIAEVIGLGKAIQFLSKIGVETFQNWENGLARLTEEKLKEIEGIKIIGEAKEKGPIVTFVVEGIHSLDIGTLLDLKGVAIRTGHLCAQPVLNFFGLTSTCRASFAFYNTTDDVASFISYFKEVISRLK